MQIHRLHIENFGKLCDFSLELQEGLNVIRADNGWGKSTLGAFLKAMFYGLACTTKRSLKENERKRYLPWQGGAFGGSLEFEAAGKCYRAERFFGTKDREDTFKLYSLETGLESGDYSAHLGEELFHLDLAAFERSSFFAQQDFKTAANGSLDARLSHVEEATGDAESYEKSVASLEKRRKFYQKTGERGELARLAQRRRELLSELDECHRQEAAAAECRERLFVKNSETQKLSREISEQEEKLRVVQAYQTKAAKKGQYDFLEAQARKKEEELQQIGVELARFERVPLEEEALDWCRENIYLLRTLLSEVEAANGWMAETKEKSHALEEERGLLPTPGARLWILAGLLTAVGMALMAVRGAVGILPLLTGILAALLGMRREWKVKKQRDRLAQELALARKAEKSACQEAATLKKRTEKLKTQLCQKLRLPKPASEKELENRWRLERQHSQEYSLLKQQYAAGRNALLRSREELEEYRSAFTEEELLELSSLQEPDRKADGLQQELTQLEARREELLREMDSIENRLHLLDNHAERIPELEEELLLTTQKLQEGTEEYKLLEKTIQYLTMAREQLSTRYLDGLQQGLQHYLGLLEPNSPVSPSLDVKLRVKLKDAGCLRELDCYSTGWQDLIQIAERFAIVDALYPDERPVLLLDDPFVNLDTGKQGRAMDLLETLAEKWQMIYFTCQGQQQCVSPQPRLHFAAGTEDGAFAHTDR